MLRKCALVAALAALTLGACGGDDDDAATDEPSTTAAAGETTTAPESDTTEPTESTATTEPIDPLLALLRTIGGSYTGTWTNTTYGSSGSIDLTLTVDEAGGTITADLDLGGDVFGGADPAAESLTITIDIANLEQPVTTTSAVFGDVTLTASPDGSLTIGADNVPGPRVARFSAQAQLTGTTFEGDYQVAFEDESTPDANGTFSATKD